MGPAMLDKSRDSWKEAGSDIMRKTETANVLPA